MGYNRAKPLGFAYYPDQLQRTMERYIEHNWAMLQELIEAQKRGKTEDSVTKKIAEEEKS